MLKTRALVAVVALPILIVMIMAGGWLFALLVTVALLVGGDEYVRLLRQGTSRPPEWLVLALIVLPLAAVWFDQPDWREPVLAFLLVGGVFYAIWAMERGHAQPLVDLALAVFGGLYIGWLGTYLLSVRKLEEGALLTLFLYGCVAFSDTSAYVIGRQWGRHKMTPRVSPKKSWEGYIAGVIGGTVFGALVGGLVHSTVLNAEHGAMIGLLIGILGTGGDLAMSMIKRQVGAKDSSHLIPGHGGILDRTDSVLVAAVVGYYYLTWFVI